MWILTLAGHDHWLKPGKTYTFGRDGTDFDLSKERSVSRRHLVIEIGNVAPGSVAHPSIRSRLTATDCGSRHGTLFNGNNMAPKTPITLEGAAATIRIGPRATIRIKWSPLTLTNPEENALDNLPSLLAPLDAKVVPNVVRDTSHYIQCLSSHHSTGLIFALIKGIPVVSERYPAALLESSADWESNYRLPNPADFCPKPEWHYNPLRSTCLSGQAFTGADYLEPIVKAAGGYYSSNDPKAYDLKDDELLLDVIVHCRPYDPGQPRHQPMFGPDPELETYSQANKRQKVDLLGFMTDHSSNKKDPDTQPQPIMKVPEKRAKAQRTVSRKPKRQKTTPRASSNHPKELPETEPEIGIGAGHQPESEPEPIDLEALKNVAIVENNVDIRTHVPQPRQNHNQSQQVQNFKAFRRKEPPRRERVQLEEANISHNPMKQGCAAGSSNLFVDSPYPAPGEPEPPGAVDDEFAFSFTT